MAKQTQRPTKPKAKDDGSKDLEILEPHRTLVLGGKKITVREYGFIDGMMLQRQVAPVVDALAKAADDDKASGGAGDVDLDGVMTALGDHADDVVTLIAASTGEEEAWVRARNDSEGRLLLITWWTVNSGFFVRRVLRKVAVAAARTKAAQKAAASAGATSTPPSSPTATISPGSEATPPAS